MMPSYSPSQETIATLLNTAIKIAGNGSRLAKEIGVSRSTVHSWEAGTKMSADAFIQLLDYVGIDFNEISTGISKPDDHEVIAEPIRIYGKVKAGELTTAIEQIRQIDSLSHIWENSAYRALTMNKPVYFDVWGDSMEPQFPNGSLIACAKPCTSDIPNLTPVIARVDDDATFKLYSKSFNRESKPEIELIPVNYPAYSIQRYHPRDVKIEYICLGVINPWCTGLRPTAGPIILRDSTPRPK